MARRKPKEENKLTYSNLRKVENQNGKYSYEIDCKSDFNEGDVVAIYDKKVEVSYGLNNPILHRFWYKDGRFISIKEYSSENLIEPKNNIVIKLWR